MSVATDVIAVTFSGGSLLVAGWARWTAHRAREWQRERDEERRATRVRVDFTHRYSPGGPDRERLYTVTLWAINDGESTEYVTEAVLEQPVERPHGVIVFGHLRDEDEPLELRPRGTLRLSADLDSDDIAAFRDGFVGVVSLGSGV
jgi:hypothetical protein